MSGGDDPFSALGPVPDEDPGAPADDQDASAPIAADEDVRELLGRAAALPLNDFGNGRRFVLHFGRDCMFVPRVGWFTWSGQVWEKDDDRLRVRRQAQRLSDLILREIPYLTHRGSNLVTRRNELSEIARSDRTAEQANELDALRKTAARHRSFANTTGNSARIKSGYEEAEVDLAVAFDDLDVEPLEVAVESGVLRFSVEDMTDDGAGKVADMTLVPHHRDQRITKMMPVAYDPGAPHPRFDAFLERIQPDRETREFIKRWLGLSMTGQKKQNIAFFYGGGANGKSVLVDLMARIMGNYAATARIESLTGTARRGGGDATPDLIPLMGARMVRAAEPDEGQRLQEGLVKDLTGGEPIMVRALHSDFVEVRPHFKLTISGNHRPEIRGTDDGIWRRVMLVPFDVQIPESERDPNLIDKLWEERSGILNWLIEGAIDYLEGGLQPPSAVTEATRDYREESDPIGQFLITCCVITGDAADTITSKDLGNGFHLHLIERGMSPWKPTTVSKQLASKARQWRHPETGRQFTKSKSSITQYVGLRFTDAFRRRFEDAPKDHQGRPLGGVSASAAPDPD
ncbi:DNA primase family protein [Pukyongiella litopenaei]|uniref:SF3 helicase domain-containing protein n=1 Tax=Pukyongiella litopenaei TaxID=2605946 RepID=A0A2S0MLA3_9RHOB|nr:DNA primase family protein [Pukyongiella litopenaei]AVO36607.1 hypothetical protein C6Y53_02105 [Pukyongiella litopenaei]